MVFINIIMETQKCFVAITYCLNWTKDFTFHFFLSVQQEDDHNPETKDENDEGDSDHKVDLDTRLKMLMKGKANMPSFLLNELNGSEEDDEEDEEDGKNFFDDFFWRIFRQFFWRIYNLFVT